MWGVPEISLISGLPLNEWLWLAALGVVIIILIVAINELLDILWRKI